MWLAPRLPAFNRLHPEIELSIWASNDTLDLEREQVDIAIRHVLFRRGEAEPPAEQYLFDHLTFPVASPGLLRKRPLTTECGSSKSRSALFETRTSGRPWLDWVVVEAKNVGNIQSAGSLRFSHYGADGARRRRGQWRCNRKLPHLSQQLRDRSLVAPSSLRRSPHRVLPCDRQTWGSQPCHREVCRMASRAGCGDARELRRITWPE